MQPCRIKEAIFEYLFKEGEVEEVMKYSIIVLNLH